jgi:hypothetical protein
MADFDDITLPPVWDPATAKRRHEVVLSVKTIVEFVDWVGAAPMTEVDTVRSFIAEGCDDDVVALLGRELNTLPIVDKSRHNVFLSILGESRRESAIAPLERFIWNVVEVLATVEYGPAQTIAPYQVVCDFGINVGRALRSRAVEMLAYIATRRAIEGAVRVIREHPEADVRRAAIDGYLFDRGDSPEAVRSVMEFARDEDREWVGIPRRTIDTNPADFYERVARLTERPPKPENVPPQTPPADSEERDHVSTRLPEF